MRLRAFQTTYATLAHIIRREHANFLIGCDVNDHTQRVRSASAHRAFVGFWNRVRVSLRYRIDAKIYGHRNI